MNTTQHHDTQCWYRHCLNNVQAHSSYEWEWKISNLNFYYHYEKRTIISFTWRLWLLKQPFSRKSLVSRHQNVSTLDFTGATNDGSGGDNGSWRHKAQVSSHIVTDQQPVFTGGMPFLLSNQQCQSNEVKSITFYRLRDLLTTSTLGVVKTRVSMTT